MSRLYETVGCQEKRRPLYGRRKLREIQWEHEMSLCARTSSSYLCSLIWGEEFGAHDSSRSWLMISVVFLFPQLLQWGTRCRSLYFQDISSKRFAPFLGHDPKDLMGMVACSNRWPVACNFQQWPQPFSLNLQLQALECLKTSESGNSMGKSKLKQIGKRNIMNLYNIL